MNYVEQQDVVWFIKTHARHSPEDLSKQGQYDEMLLSLSTVVHDMNDTVICPSF